MIFYFNIISKFFLTFILQIELGLSGNPITEFLELRKLIPLKRLESLILNDVHFNPCPISQTKGYKEFIICFLSQLRLLDGVIINRELQFNATTAYNKKVTYKRRSYTPIYCHQRNKIVYAPVILFSN